MRMNEKNIISEITEGKSELETNVDRLLFLFFFFVIIFLF